MALTRLSSNSRLAEDLLLNPLHYTVPSPPCSLSVLLACCFPIAFPLSSGMCSFHLQELACFLLKQASLSHSFKDEAFAFLSPFAANQFLLLHCTCLLKSLLHNTSLVLLCLKHALVSHMQAFLINEPLSANQRCLFSLRLINVDFKSFSASISSNCFTRRGLNIHGSHVTSPLTQLLNLLPPLLFP